MRYWSRAVASSVAGIFVFRHLWGGQVGDRAEARCVSHEGGRTTGPCGRAAGKSLRTRRDDVVALSALRGEGVADLIKQVAAKLTVAHRRYAIELDVADGAAAAWLHAHGDVLDQQVDDTTIHFDVRLSPEDHDRFYSRPDR